MTTFAGTPTREDWFVVAGVEAIPSPSLLLFNERIDANLQEMLRIAGGPTRLRPHLKTHKLPELVRRQLALGIQKFKAATLVEAAMAAHAGAHDILLAYQPVGPAVTGFMELMAAYPDTRFSCLADSEPALGELSKAAVAADMPVEVLVDLDIGQHRTGIPAGDDAANLYQELAGLPGLRPGGLHAYDGHIGDSDVNLRTQRCQEAFEPVACLRQQLVDLGFPVPRVVAGGSPTFPIHAGRPDVELSPGTTVLWDAGYAQKLPDLAFRPAAVLLGRVISKPGSGHLCVDLGHKAVAAEMPHPRLVFLNLPEARAVTHSEEHLVVETPVAHERKVGDAVYALPWHVCPTVALHESVHSVVGGHVVESWRVTARTRRLVDVVPRSR